MTAHSGDAGKLELDLLTEALCEYAGIITNFVNPPIPPRNNDWCAYYDGREEGGPQGWGQTQAAAIRDLVVNYPDDRPGNAKWIEAATALGKALAALRAAEGRMLNASIELDCGTKKQSKQILEDGLKELRFAMHGASNA
ncbi:MAG: hypothetical protein KF826_15755 [Xanthobacteraceae bacterium]|nr:hypothetical protein [Xanthobacteraceae bacterium]MCW5678413.1 hypothetical protein [Xanthobacteraceae bacterium]